MGVAQNCASESPAHKAGTVYRCFAKGSVNPILASLCRRYRNQNAISSSASQFFSERSRSPGGRVSPALSISDLCGFGRKFEPFAEGCTIALIQLSSVLAESGRYLAHPEREQLPDFGALPT